MVVSDPEATASDDSFVETSQLTYLVPFATNLNLEGVFKDADDSRAVFDSIEKRESLFFDEAVDVLLILSTPWAAEKALRSHLGRLLISLEARVVNAHSPEKDSPPASEVIFTGSVEEVDDPFIVVDDAALDPDDSEGNDGEPQKQQIYAVWKLSVFLSRPRIRLQSPSIVFTAIASLRPPGASAAAPNRRTSGYLTSGVPSSLNLLESLSADPALGGVVPRLSALRVSRVAPLTRSPDAARRLRAPPPLSLKVFPVAHTRVRFSRPSTVPVSTALTALLEVDFTPFFACPVLLDAIALTVPGGAVEDLNAAAGVRLPLRCEAHDHVTFLYRLTPLDPDLVAKDPARDLDISIRATARVRPGVCEPALTMAWTTSLDFTLPVNPGFGSAVPPIQRAHRPSQLSISGNESLVPSSVSRPDALPSLEATPRTETALPDLGITITFAAPAHPVRAGELFSWTVHVVNRSPPDRDPPAAPRKLALVAVPRRRRPDVRMARPPSTHSARRGPDARRVADAVLDENVVHALQRGAAVESTDIVCLSADTRVGPLAPGACHVVELRFLALQEGVVGLEAVRVVDLGSQEHVDVRDLPVMIIKGDRDEA